MDRRDYILRMIEQVGQMLIALRKLIVGRLAGDAEIETKLREAAARGGVDLELARLTTAETLALLVAPTGDVEPGRCWLYAETLYLDGLNAQTRGLADHARASYGKARLLFTMVKPWGGQLVGWPEADDRIAEIDRRLRDLDDRTGDDDPDDPILPVSLPRARRAGRSRVAS
jgi:hypothetical protein